MLVVYDNFDLSRLHAVLFSIEYQRMLDTDDSMIPSSVCFEIANYSQVESFVVPEVRPSCEGTIRGTYFVMSTPLADHAIGRCRRLDTMVWRRREADSTGLLNNTMAPYHDRDDYYLTLLRMTCI